MKVGWEINMDYSTLLPGLLGTFLTTTTKAAPYLLQNVNSYNSIHVYQVNKTEDKTCSIFFKKSEMTT